MACSPWRSQLTACRIRSCASICSSGRNLAEFLMPETGIQRISVHLAECHEGDNDESSSEAARESIRIAGAPDNTCRRLWQRFQSGGHLPLARVDTEMRMQRAMSYERRSM